MSQLSSPTLSSFSKKLSLWRFSLRILKHTLVPILQWQHLLQTRPHQSRRRRKSFYGSYVRWIQLCWHMCFAFVSRSPESSHTEIFQPREASIEALFPPECMQFNAAIRSKNLLLWKCFPIEMDLFIVFFIGFRPFCFWSAIPSFGGFDPRWSRWRAMVCNFLGYKYGYLCGLLLPCGLLLLGLRVQFLWLYLWIVVLRPHAATIAISASPCCFLLRVRLEVKTILSDADGGDHSAENKKLYKCVFYSRWRLTYRLDFHALLALRMVASRLHTYLSRCLNDGKCCSFCFGWTRPVNLAKMNWISKCSSCVLPFDET